MNTTRTLRRSGAILARTRAVLWGAACLSWFGCPETSETGRSQAEIDCEARYAEFDKRAVHACECATSSESSYCDSLDEYAEKSVCYCEFEAAETENAEVLGCLARVEAEFTACFVSLECGDEQGRLACEEQYFAATDACGLLSKPSRIKVEVECRDDIRAFRCGSGEWVPRWALCDKTADCADGADESDEACFFTCKDGSKVSPMSRCNGMQDCMDWSDEEECGWSCVNHESIPEEEVCDRFPDCQDGSDEVGC